MIDTPYGETATVEELCRYANIQRPAEPGWLPGEGELQPALDTRPFPVLIRVIERPAVLDDFMEVITPAEIRTFVLETEDIEVADNCVWLLVGAPYEIDPEGTPPDPDKA